MAKLLALRLRAVALVLAVALALGGQAFAPLATAMLARNATMLTMSSTQSGMCPDCRGMDHSKAMLSDCAVSVCAGLVAVLPAIMVAEARTLASPAMVPQRDGRGITIPPDTGPPRPFPLT